MLLEILQPHHADLHRRLLDHLGVNDLLKIRLVSKYLQECVDKNYQFTIKLDDQKLELLMTRESRILSTILWKFSLFKNNYWKGFKEQKSFVQIKYLIVGKLLSSCVNEMTLKNILTIVIQEIHFTNVISGKNLNFILSRLCPKVKVIYMNHLCIGSKTEKKLNIFKTIQKLIYWPFHLSNQVKPCGVTDEANYKLCQLKRVSVDCQNVHFDDDAWYEDNRHTKYLDLDLLASRIISMVLNIKGQLKLDMEKMSRGWMDKRHDYLNDSLIIQYPNVTHHFTIQLDGLDKILRIITNFKNYSTSF